MWLKQCCGALRQWCQMINSRVGGEETIRMMTVEKKINGAKDGHCKKRLKHFIIGPNEDSTK